MAAEPREMPDLHDQSLEEARLTLRAADLTFTIQRVQSKAVPEGQLIGVSPQPGTLLAAGASAVLVVSCGPPTVRQALSELAIWIWVAAALALCLLGFGIYAWTSGGG